jgi:hypothetical protein
MNSIVKDLAEVSRGACAAGRETRDIAWKVLLHLADQGDDEAMAALDDIRRAGKRRNSRATATIGDTCKTQKRKG